MSHRPLWKAGGFFASEAWSRLRDTHDTKQMARNTTMDKLAVGARFRFGHFRTHGPVFTKVSNLYARGEDGVVRQNTYDPHEAPLLKVTLDEEQPR